MILKSTLLLVVALVFAGCSSVPTAQLAGTGKKHISVQFQDFVAGSVCTVETPQGSVTAPEIPGRANYPVEFTDSPVACTTPDGSVYDVKVSELLPKGHSTAGLTAYQTGLLVATTSVGGQLMSLKNEAGVVKRSAE